MNISNKNTNFQEFLGISGILRNFRNFHEFSGISRKLRNNNGISGISNKKKEFREFFTANKSSISLGFWVCRQSVQNGMNPNFEFLLRH
jgi:hypothetical protein